MTHIFNLVDNDNVSEKISLDELYEKKHQSDLVTLNIFNRILTRIHTRIKSTSRTDKNCQFTTFIVPEVMIGIPTSQYNCGECTAYLMEKLKENGFLVKYTHPNLLFISWAHWIPDYVRTEIKKKTGTMVDGHGNINNKNKNNNYEEDDDPNMSIFNSVKLNSKKKEKEKEKEKDFKSINSYVPSGNLVYNEDLLNKLNRKMN